VIIKIRADLCCGTRLCVKAAPGVFALDELGYNKMDGQRVPPGQEEAARRAAGMCPESAIRLVAETEKTA
jgi:ferredoxin